MKNLEPREPNFFIMGLPRSGSTLLSTLLSESPQLFVINDSLLFRRFWRMQNWVNEIRSSGALKCYSTDSTAFTPTEDLDQEITLSQAKWFLAIVIDGYYYGGISSDPTKNTARMATHADLLDVGGLLGKLEDERLTWREFLAYVFGSLIPPEHSDKMHLGEKTPGHILIADWIMWPEDIDPDKSVLGAQHPSMVGGTFFFMHNYPKKNVPPTAR